MIGNSLGLLRPFFKDSCGKPLRGGKIYTYEPNSVTPKPTYTDSNLSIENTNPVILDHKGEADIFLKGDYRIIVKDRKGTLVYDAPWVGGSDGGFDAVEDYSGFNGLSAENGQIVFVKKLELSGHFIYVENSTKQHDGGTVIVDSRGRVWERKFSGDIKVKWFNVDKTGVRSSHQAFIDAESTAYSLDTDIILDGGGKYLIDQDIVIRRPLRVSGAPATLIAETTANINRTLTFARTFDCTNIIFQNLKVQCFNTTGFSVNIPFSFEKCLFRTSKLLLGQAGNFTAFYKIKSNSFSSSLNNNFDNIEIIDASSIEIAGNKFRGGINNIKFEPKRSFSTCQISIKNNTFGSWIENSILVNGSSMNHVSSINLEGNTFAGSRRVAYNANRSGITLRFANKVLVKSNSISNASLNFVAEGVTSLTLDDNTFTCSGTATLGRIIGCADITIKENTFNHDTAGQYSLLVGNYNTLPATTGNFTPSRGIHIFNNKFHVNNLGIKISGTAVGDVSGNEFKARNALTANGLLWIDSTCSKITHRDNTYYAPSGSPIKNEQVDVIVKDALNVSVVTPPVINTPIITESDNSLNGAKSYVVSFSVSDYSQIRQAVDIQPFAHNAYTLTEWMGRVGGSNLAINSSAWNTTTKFLYDLVADGVAIDHAGGSDYTLFTGCAFFDKFGRMYCRDFTSKYSVSSSNTYSTEIVNSIREAQISEGAHNTIIMRCPLIVNGAIYDPTQTFMLAKSTYDTELSARTTIGQKADGTFIVLCVDGVTGVSGTTMKNCAEKLLALGCVNAFNCDGGGSTTLWYNGVVINNPSDAGGERKIAACLYIK